MNSTTLKERNCTKVEEEIMTNAMSEIVRGKKTLANNRFRVDNCNALLRKFGLNEMKINSTTYEG